MLDVADGVIATDKVFDAVTKDVDVVVLSVWSVAVITCKIFPVGIAAGRVVTLVNDWFYNIVNAIIYPIIFDIAK